MDINLLRCASLVKDEGFTVAFSNGTELITSTQRGVSPLLKILDEHGSLPDFYAADKVVGRAAAFIYVLLGVRQLFAITVSDGACEILNRYGVSFFYENRVPVIRNRTDTDLCPMEKAAAAANTPKEAVAIIRETLEKLTNK